VDFWPIIILNASVKIISKILTNGLREVLGDIIGDHQTGFLKGKSILDTIAAAQEVLHFTKRNKTSSYILKLDFEEAYVRWTQIASWRLRTLGGFRKIYCKRV